jgi:hypothetical protein
MSDGGAEHGPAPGWLLPGGLLPGGLLLVL